MRPRRGPAPPPVLLVPLAPVPAVAGAERERTNPPPATPISIPTGGRAAAPGGRAAIIAALGASEHHVGAAARLGLVLQHRIQVGHDRLQIRGRAPPGCPRRPP